MKNKNRDAEKTITATGPASRRKIYPFLLLDAVLYCLLAHQAADAVLLAHDGLFSWLTAAGILCAIVVALMLLERHYWVLNKKFDFTPHTPRLAVAAGLIVFIVLFIWFPIMKVNAPVGKGMTYLFLPLEWHKFPRNYILMWRLSPWYCLAVAAICAGLVYLRFVSKRRLWVVLGLFALFFLLSIKSLSVVNFNKEHNLSFFFYPLLAMSLVGMFGWPRLFARTVVAGWAFALIGMFYAGMMPLKFALGPGVDKSPAIETIYAPSRHTSDIAPMFFREMTVEPDGRSLFISYGPTSGIVKINVERKNVDTLLHIPGMMRFLWDSGGEDGQILGLDWLHADMRFFSKTPFKLIRTVDLLATDPTPSPFDFDVDPAHGRLFIVNYELPGVSVYSYPGMEKIDRSDFQEQGVSPMDSGGQKIVYDRKRDLLYVLTGWTDWMQHYLILAVNPRTLRIEQRIELPTAGLELAFCEENNSLISVDFYGRTLYEVSVPDLKLKRKMTGPLGSRNVVCDPVRNAVYATGYADGMLNVIDYATGKTTARFSVGAKPSSMALLADRGELFIGSGAGILKVKLDKIKK